MSASERALRSKLAKLAHSAPLVRGTVAVRQKRCGKPNCRCTNGDPHRGVYLTLSLDGKLKQVSIPTSMEDAVREWVHNYQQIRELLEKLSQFYLAQIPKK